MSPHIQVRSIRRRVASTQVRGQGLWYVLCLYSKGIQSLYVLTGNAARIREDAIDDEELAVRRCGFADASQDLSGVWVGPVVYD